MFSICLNNRQTVKNTQEIELYLNILYTVCKNALLYFEYFGENE